jgi:glycosyltransferase involved in cell wall biosynthesis
VFYKLNGYKTRLKIDPTPEIHTKCQTQSKEKTIWYEFRGQVSLIKAFKIVKNKYNLGLRLVLTCQKEDVPFDLIKGLEKHIEFAGYVSEDQLTKLYQEALLFAFPSLYEGLGFPPLEAISHGCPALVSNAASLPEVCGDAAYFVDPYDEESIADGIYQVATDSVLRETLIKKSLDRAKLFTWEETGKKHIQIFEKILNDS